MVSKVSGVWMVEMIGRPLPFVMVKGKLTVEGKPVELKPTNDKEYPVAAGWFRSTPNSFVQITPTDVKVVVKVGETMRPIPVKKPSIIRVVKTIGGDMTVVLAEGKLTVNGEPFELKSSDDKEYPAEDGWLKYTDISFLQVSATDIKIELKAGSMKLPTTVTTPKPVPLDSKYLHVY